MTEEETRKQISEMLLKDFPDEAIKSRKGAGNKDLDYVEGHTVIRRMLTATAGNYSTEYLGHFLQGDKFYVWLRVIVPGLGHHDGLGVSNTTGGEDVLKGAVTDAYKNACKYFGVGLHMYGEDYEAPVVIPPKKRLSQLLLSNGMKTRAAVNAAATEKFGKELDKLSDSDIMLWIEELEKVTA